MDKYVVSDSYLICLPLPNKVNIHIIGMKGFEIIIIAIIKGLLHKKYGRLSSLSPITSYRNVDDALWKLLKLLVRD